MHATPSAVIMRDETPVDEVYALIGPQARAAVNAVRTYRARLAAVDALKGLQPCMAAADAEKLGISVLREHSDGSMAVGMFVLPALNVNPGMVPRSELQ